MTTIKDVARAAGVSVATVSRAMHPELASSVSPKTREKINLAAAQLAYEPSPLARALKSSRSGLVGFIVPSTVNPFYVQVLRHLEAELAPAGYRILTSFLSEGRDETAAIQDLMALRAGTILFCGLDRSSEKVFRDNEDRCRPIQLFNAAYPNYTQIVMNDEEGARMATKHLLDLGHKKIFFAGGDERIEGYRKAYQDVGLPLPGPELQAPPFCIDEVRLAEQIRTSGATAVLGISRQGYHVCRAILLHLHLSIPDDISLIVYDDSEWAEMLGITTVAHPLEKIAQTVLACLQAKDPADFPLRTVIEPYLILRSSTKQLTN
ncbi:MAG: LacI family DNA-binding transcriptional regulator [Clostridia bacterium]|nr:LacI family DNA-binding transcriptional regulator [Clostridia bacterium]